MVKYCTQHGTIVITFSHFERNLHLGLNFLFTITSLCTCSIKNKEHINMENKKNINIKPLYSFSLIFFFLILLYEVETSYIKYQSIKTSIWVKENEQHSAGVVACLNCCYVSWLRRQWGWNSHCFSEKLLHLVNTFSSHAWSFSDFPPSSHVQLGFLVQHPTYCNSHNSGSFPLVETSTL